ncbi:MAG: hypothetical protein IPG50_24170 [Myxococcales bacterium]|nr:hypothetical protein [Myxococcales bacterium]
MKTSFITRSLAASLLSLACAQGCGSGERPAASSVDGGAPVVVETPGISSAMGAVATLKGRVLAPDGKTPVAGALVALMRTAPEAPKEGLRCETCVPLSKDTPHATSNADGTFELKTSTEGAFTFVVQKGTFRRARALDVVSGDQEVPALLATLPSKTDLPKGDVIPKMAVVKGEWDPIERTLAKLGLGKLVKGEADPSSLPFDVYDDPSPTGPRSGARLLADESLLAAYEIVLLPCSGSSGTTCDDKRAMDPLVQKALRGFVEGGGRLYVTDYSYEFVRQLWPGAVSFRGETKDVGSACEKVAYDATGAVNDEGLSGWLSAIGHSSVTLKASWTTIDSVHEVDATDANGQPAKIPTRVWMSANKSDGAHPATVSFERGCGRVLFSTYHTAGEPLAPLMPQEKALLYVLLEMGVCIDTSVPK